MNAASAKLLVLTTGHMACIKIAGRANFTSSLDFKTLIEELSEKSVRHFVLDLSECMLMDSTFLGVLAGFGLKMSKNRELDGQSIELMNPSPRISDLLENLGVMHLFKVVTCSDIPDDGQVPVAVPGAHASREEITSNCLKAHLTLMEIDAGNVPKFKEVAVFLAEDLKKMKNGS
jgi:anti-anti-sigma factor